MIDFDLAFAFEINFPSDSNLLQCSKFLFEAFYFLRRGDFFISLNHLLFHRFIFFLFLCQLLFRLLRLKFFNLAHLYLIYTHFPSSLIHFRANYFFHLLFVIASDISRVQTEGFHLHYGKEYSLNFMIRNFGFKHLFFLKVHP